MKAVNVFVASAVAVVAVGTVDVCCTPGAQTVANTALDVAEYACVIANADLPSTSAVAQACGIADNLIPAIQQVISDFKGQRAAYAAKQMCPDKK